MGKRVSVESLQARARLFRPPGLTAKEAGSSLLPRLIQTQETSIGVLYVADSNPTAWSDVPAVGRAPLAPVGHGREP